VGDNAPDNNRRLRAREDGGPPEIAGGRKQPSPTRDCKAEAAQRRTLQRNAARRRCGKDALVKPPSQETGEARSHIRENTGMGQLQSSRREREWRKHENALRLRQYFSFFLPQSFLVFGFAQSKFARCAVEGFD